MLNIASIAKRFRTTIAEPGRAGKAVVLDCRHCAQRPAHRELLCKRCYHKAMYRLRIG